MDQASFFFHVVVVCHGPWPLEALQSVAAAKATPRQHNTCRHVDRPGCGPLPRPPQPGSGKIFLIATQRPSCPSMVGCKREESQQDGRQ